MSLNVDSARRVTRAAAPHLVAAAKTGGGASMAGILLGRGGNADDVARATVFLAGN